MPVSFMTRPVFAMLGAILLAACGTVPSDWTERSIRVAVDAPNPCWSLAIERIYRDDDGLLAVSRLQPPEPGRMCAQVITTLSHEVTLRLPEGPVTHAVLGRGWDWESDAPGYVFPRDRAALDERLAGARLLHEVADGEGRHDAGGAIE